MRRAVCILLLLFLTVSMILCKALLPNDALQSIEGSEASKETQFELDGDTTQTTQDDEVYVPLQSLQNLPDIPGFSDRVDDSNKVFRSRLASVEKQLYDKFLPYVLSFIPVLIPCRNMDYDAESLTNALYAIQWDYPETWIYFQTYCEYDPSWFLNPSGDQYDNMYAVALRYDAMDFFADDGEHFDVPYVKDYIDRVNKACDAILEQMPQGLSTREKYIWLADYLCSVTEYEDKVEYIYADGPILYGKGICQSYAYAYQWLCQNAGLWCTSCSGWAGDLGHCWNVVKLDNGKTYYMDVTWADSSNKPNLFYFMTYERCLLNCTLDEGEWIADGD